MNDVTETVAGLVDRVRHTTPQMGLVRLTLAVLCVLLLVVVRSWTGEDLSGVALVTLVLVGIPTVARPDTAAPGLYLGGLALWWLVGWPRAGTVQSTVAAVDPWQHVTVVVLAAAVHIVAAQAAALPSHVEMSPATSFSMLVGGGGYVIVSGLAALLVVLLVAGGSAMAAVPVAVAAVVLLLAAVAGAVLAVVRT